MTIRTQTRSPGTVVSDDSIGEIAWSDPDKAEVEDNDPATATGPGISEWLKCTGYGFTLPDDSDPLGFEVIRRVRGSGGTAPGFGSVSSNTVVGGTSLTINKPSGASEGETLIACVIKPDSSGVYTLPSDWAEERTSQPAGNYRMSLFTKELGEAEPADYTWSWTGASDAIGIIYRATAENGVDVVGTFGTQAASGTTMTAPTVAPIAGATRLVAFFWSGDNATSHTPPGGMTERADVRVTGTGGVERVMSVADEVLSSAGATGERSATANGITSFRVGILVALRPPTVRDSAVRLVLGDVIGSADRSTGDDWPTSYESLTVGAPDDLFGETPTASEVNASDTGCAFSVTLLGPSLAEADVVFMRVTYAVAVAVTITAPTGSGTVTEPGFTVEWDAEIDSTPVTQASYRVRLYHATSAALLYDSGTIANATKEHVINSGTPVQAWTAPENGIPVRVVVDMTEDGSADPDGVGDAISGVSETTITTAWTPLPAITGITATAVTEEA